MKMGGTSEASLGVNLRVTAHSNQGGRKYMEDMFCVAYQPTVDDKDLLYAYFGIFDGHGGRDAAIYAKTHLMDHIVSQKNFWSDDDELVLKSIKEGFINTHMAMWKELDRWPKTPSGLPSTSGTTASIAFVRKGKIYIGHVGDSAIIMGYQDPGTLHWSANPLTKDHKPENVVENSRITQSGGKVINKSGVPRVVWNRPRIGHKGPVRRSTRIDEIPFLAVARSLGDLWSYNSSLNEFVVSPEPDVSVVDIDVGVHRCLILGSDGLWNMLSPQDAVNSVYFAEKNNERQLLAAPVDVPASHLKNWINPSKRLVDRALDRWFSHNLRADNTSVVTVVIDPPGPPKAQGFRLHQRAQMARQSVIPATPIIKTPNAVLVNMVPHQGLSQDQVQTPSTTTTPNPTPSQPQLPSSSPYSRLFFPRNKNLTSSPTTTSTNPNAIPSKESSSLLSSSNIKETKSTSADSSSISNQPLSSDLPSSSSMLLAEPSINSSKNINGNKKRKRVDKSSGRKTKSMIQKTNTTTTTTTNLQMVRPSRHSLPEYSDIDKSLNIEDKKMDDDVQINEVSSSSDSANVKQKITKIAYQKTRKNQKMSKISYQPTPKTRLSLSRTLKSSSSIQSSTKRLTRSKKVVLKPKLASNSAPATPLATTKETSPTIAKKKKTLSTTTTTIHQESTISLRSTRTTPTTPTPALKVKIVKITGALQVTTKRNLRSTSSRTLPPRSKREKRGKTC